MPYFLKETFKYPKFTGAVKESSQRLADLITDSANLASADSIVELGPGTGVFSKRIMQKKNVNTSYFAIEINPSFVQQMRQHLPECKVYCDSSEHLGRYLKMNNVEYADRIISGLPWTAFETSLQKRLIEEIHRHLTVDGVFVTFAYFPLNHLPSGRRFKTLLQNTFDHVAVTKVVWLNFPPAFVYVCKK